MKVGKTASCLLAFLCLLPCQVWAAPTGKWGGRDIEVFAGSASKPALEASARRFEERAGARVLLHLGGSGAVLAQMELARRGDIYFPGSSDFMEAAKARKLVDPATEVRVAYLLPVINVPKGNPKKILGLKDLSRPGLRVGIARPESVCVGLYGVEALEEQGLTEAVRPNITGVAESCEKTAQILSLGLVDAVLGWDVFSRWDPTRIETVYLPPSDVPRIGYLPAALSVFSREREAASAFLEFLGGPEGKAIFAAEGYITDLRQARRHARPDTPVGGEWSLPPSWNRPGATGSR